MEGSTTPQPCYCIAGHGRSGTSFIAEMLQSAGLDIGRRLMGPGEANRRGHFEDMDLHEFHVAVLTSQGFGVEGFILEPSVRVQEQFVAPARAMVDARRRAGKPWGWKEPRSTLFLDFWRATVPELKFLLLFRRPWDVMDSLFRRGDSIYQKNPNLAIQVWMNYNRAVLDFLGRHPDRCLLVESYAVAREPQRLTRAIADRFGEGLGTIGEGVYEDDLFRHEDTSHQRSILAHFFPEAIALYEQLRSRADLALPPEEPAEAVAVADADIDWALQYWVDFRRLQSQDHWVSRQLQIQLDASQQQLRQVQAQREQLRSEVAPVEHVRTILGRVEAERDDFRIRLEHTEAELERAWAEAEHVRTALGRVEAERDECRGQLTRSDRTLQAVRGHRAWMESSKFWKLRLLWLRVRSALRRAPSPADGTAADANGPGHAHANGDGDGSLAAHPQLFGASLLGHGPGTAEASHRTPRQCRRR